MSGVIDDDAKDLRSRWHMTSGEIYKMTGIPQEWIRRNCNYETVYTGYHRCDKLSYYFNFCEVVRKYRQAGLYESINSIYKVNPDRLDKKIKKIACCNIRNALSSISATIAVAACTPAVNMRAFKKRKRQVAYRLGRSRILERERKKYEIYKTYKNLSDGMEAIGKYVAISACTPATNAKARRWVVFKGEAIKCGYSKKLKFSKLKAGRNNTTWLLNLFSKYFSITSA